MAGYIMTIGEQELLDKFYSPSKSEENMESSKAKARVKAKEYALEKCITEGIYSAICPPKGASFIGTMADFLCMKSGDDIYFFTDRKIYGIGKLVDIAGIDCRFRIHAKDNSGVDLVETVDDFKHQFVCTFAPAPHFFRTGVDMDEALMFSPEKIRSLRFFSNRTFMKLDDIESNAIKNIIARKNERYLKKYDKEKHFTYSHNVHKQIEERLNDNAEGYRLSVFDYIENGKKSPSEYYIEGAVMDLLRKGWKSKNIGEWDFIGRQYPASPPKPSQYVDSMDLFGYRYVPGFPDAISKYIVIELKTGTISREHVQQTMKYVDWISREYTKGDYSMIEAYTVGFDKEDDIEEKTKDIVERNYIIENRPVKNKKWQELRILSYRTLLNELIEKEHGGSDD